MVGAIACAHPRPGDPGAAATPRQRLTRSLVELDSGQYAPAIQELQLLAQTYPRRVIGRQALLITAAAQLDPRDAPAQPDQAAALLTQYLGGAGATDWTRPVAETLYLLALDAGATAAQAQADSARAHAQAARAATRLPRLPRPPLSARVADLEHERDRLTARVKELETGTVQLQKELADSVRELRRIRRTLRP